MNLFEQYKQDILRRDQLKQAQQQRSPSQHSHPNSDQTKPKPTTQTQHPHEGVNPQLRFRAAQLERERLHNITITNTATTNTATTRRYTPPFRRFSINSSSSSSAKTPESPPYIHVPPNTPRSRASVDAGTEEWEDENDDDDDDDDDDDIYSLPPSSPRRRRGGDGVGDGFGFGFGLHDEREGASESESELWQPWMTKWFGVVFVVVLGVVLLGKDEDEDDIDVLGSSNYGHGYGYGYAYDDDDTERVNTMSTSESLGFGQTGRILIWIIWAIFLWACWCGGCVLYEAALTALREGEMFGGVRRGAVKRRHPDVRVVRRERRGLGRRVVDDSHDGLFGEDRRRTVRIQDVPKRVPSHLRPS